jgi:hypothetical protein
MVLATRFDRFADRQRVHRPLWAMEQSSVSPPLYPTVASHLVEGSLHGDRPFLDSRWSGDLRTIAETLSSLSTPQTLEQFLKASGDCPWAKMRPCEQQSGADRFDPLSASGVGQDPGRCASTAQGAARSATLDLAETAESRPKEIDHEFAT